MTVIKAIRHAEIPLNKEIMRRYIAGRSASQEITEHGREEAEQMGSCYLSQNYKPEFARVSPAIRARQTGEIILSICAPEIELITTDRLHEISLGAYEGKDRNEVYTDEVVAEIQKKLLDFKLPGTESMREVAERGIEEVLKLGRLYPDQTGFIFTHYMTISTMVGQILGLSHSQIRNADIGNCSETELVVIDGKIKVSHVGRSLIDLAA